MELSWSEPKQAIRKVFRQDLHKVVLFLFVICLFTFLAVWGINVVLKPIIPKLPWISDNWVDPDPPPLVTAFICAGFAAVLIAILMVFQYVIAPSESICLGEHSITTQCIFVGKEEHDYDRIRDVRILPYEKLPQMQVIQFASPGGKKIITGYRFLIPQSVAAEDIVALFTRHGVPVEHLTKG